MKKLFLLFTITFLGCNTVIHEGEENSIQNAPTRDTTNNVGKLNDIINENRVSNDSINDVEKLEPELKNSPK